MVMTLSRGCGLPPNPRCGLPRSRASLITPLGGNTTDWRAGCGRSARPVRREGECFLALSLPLSGEAGAPENKNADLKVGATGEGKKDAPEEAGIKGHLRRIGAQVK